MPAMACVFALLAVSLMSLLPRTDADRDVVSNPAGRLRVAGRSAASRPPSLLVLCIGRT